jgi:hypothetical protein
MGKSLSNSSMMQSARAPFLPPRSKIWGGRVRRHFKPRRPVCIMIPYRIHDGIRYDTIARRNGPCIFFYSYRYHCLYYRVLIPDSRE